MGVIAVAAFRDVPWVHRRRQSGRQEIAPKANAPGEPRSEKSMGPADVADAAGTRFTNSHHSRSVRAHFRPQWHAFTTQLLKYEWRQALVKPGIIRQRPQPNRFWPEQLGQVQSPGYWNQRR